MTEDTQQPATGTRWFDREPAAAWYEDATGTDTLSWDITGTKAEAKKMGAEVHYLYAEQKPLGARIGLGPGGTLVLQLELRDGTPYEVELPEGKAEKVIKLLLEGQRAKPQSAIGERAGATVFAMKEILAAMGETITVTKVAGGKRTMGLTLPKSLEDMGL